jgi:hypothetical protein
VPVECIEFVNATNIVQAKEYSEESWTFMATRLVLLGVVRKGKAAAAQTQFDQISSSGEHSSIGNSLKQSNELPLS